jgi:hypothetical protein
VNRKSTLSIPEPIAELQRQLDQFRSTQSRRTKLRDLSASVRDAGEPVLLSSVCAFGKSA